MTSVAAVRRPPSTLGDATLLGVALLMGLMGLNVANHSDSVYQGGLPTAVACAAILLLYGVAAAWGRSRPADPSRTALSRGAALGLALGALQAVHIGLEHFADLAAPF